mgnify:CR=1 FL=1|tara:strand:+ start:643 stop:924 length:282 start_codon:yes stop_codon:yes gene_type:complete
MRYSEIDRFSESHDATLANITAILYERLGCTHDVSHDYILDKLREIKEFDSSHNLGIKCVADVVGEHTKSFHSLYTYLWKLENGRKRRNDGTS